MNKNTKRWLVVLLLLALIYYFWWRGQRIEKSLMESVSTNTPPIRGNANEQITIQNADTDYPDNPTLLCCNLGGMVSLADPTQTSCTAVGMSNPVNGTCGGSTSTTNTSWTTTQSVSDAWRP